jgi:hypothetical protein
MISHFFLGEAAESAFQDRHSFAANRRTGNVAFDSKPKAWHLGQSPAIGCEAASSFAIRCSSPFIPFEASFDRDHFLTPTRGEPSSSHARPPAALARLSFVSA